MSEIPLNKFEKRNLILRLLKEGKTYREICHLAHVSPRDIKPIAKEYERKKRLENNKRKGNTQEPTTKKLSKSSQAFILYQEGKKISDVKILLDIPFKQAMIFWVQYLKSIRMEDCYEFYKEHSYDIPTLLSINNFLERNDIYGKDIVIVLRQANNIINLNQTILNLRGEIEKLKQNKNNYSLNQNTMKIHYLPPLGPLPRYYNW